MTRTAFCQCRPVSFNCQRVETILYVWLTEHHRMANPQSQRTPTIPVPENTSSQPKFLPRWAPNFIVDIWEPGLMYIGDGGVLNNDLRHRFTERPEPGTDELSILQARISVDNCSY
jgi:hypothetical protein